MSNVRLSGTSVRVLVHHFYFGCKVPREDSHPGIAIHVLSDMCFVSYPMGHLQLLSADFGTRYSRVSPHHMNSVPQHASL